MALSQFIHTFCEPAFFPESAKYARVYSEAARFADFVHSASARHKIGGESVEELL